MDSDSWSDRLASASRRYQLGFLSPSDNLLGLEEIEGEDDFREGYACPFCSDYFDIVSLCCHLDEDHPLNTINRGQVLERDLASLHKAHRITGFGPRTPESGPKISPVNWSIGMKTDLNDLVLRSIDLLVSVGSTNHRSAPSPSNAKIGPGPLGQTILRANKRHTHEGYKKTTEEQEKGSANRH